MSPTNSTPGWHLDPAGSGRLRWWDGTQWTNQYHQPGTPSGAATTRRIPTFWKVGGALLASLIGLAIIGNLADSDDSKHTVAATETSTSTTTTPTTTTTTATQATAKPLDSAAATAAAAKLETLPVKGRAPATGYSRDQFGQAWSDDVTVADGHNGCDTRNDVLKSMDEVTIKPGTQGCVVESGVLNDPYTGTTLNYSKASSSNTIEVDHVVALMDSWQTGAQLLTADERRDFANDPRNLQPTAGPTNTQKGAGDAASWLPPNKPYRCTYVARQIDVKAAYRLWVTDAEKSAMQRVLSSCGARLPETTTSTTTTTTSATTTDTYIPQTTVPPPPPTLDTTTAPRYVAPAPAPPDDGDAYYRNCSAARAAGAAPIYAGQPGYRAGLDRDGDGVACE